MPLSTVATDNFNRADGGVGANWSNALGGNDPQIVSNQAKIKTVGVDSITFWNANSFANNQYSQITIPTLGSGTNVVPLVIVHASASHWVCFRWLKTTNKLQIVWDNTTVMAETTGSFSAGDEIRLEVEGDDYRAYINDVEVLTADGSGYAEPTTGAAGFGIYETDAANTRLDDWEGGDITAGGTAIKTVNGLAKASVKTFNGLAIASVKSINGLQ